MPEVIFGLSTCRPTAASSCTAKGINIGRIRSQLWVYSVTGNAPPVLLTGAAVESDGQFSPNGRWVASIPQINPDKRKFRWSVFMHHQRFISSVGYGTFDRGRKAFEHRQPVSFCRPRK